jgi:hypothetical protein
LDLPRNPTRSVKIGSVMLGAGHPIAVQSMTATQTRNVEATVGQVNDLEAAGAGIVRIAVDSAKDAEALAEIRAPGWPKLWHPRWTRSDTTRAICTITSGISRGRTR